MNRGCPGMPTMSYTPQPNYKFGNYNYTNNTITQHAATAFQQADRNNSRSLTGPEVSQAVRIFGGLAGVNFSNNDISQMIYQFDQDRNGQVSLQEFQNVLLAFINKHPVPQYVQPKANFNRFY